jgi:superfamily I DNA/RNA helicase
MDKAMKEVHIECAGAGKTYGIANKILDILDDCPEDKNIYIITFTNYAVKQIRDELIKNIRDIPDKVIIDTVHGFFLNNIIYPYSCYVKGEALNSCSVEKLPDDIKWQSKRKRNLKDYGLIHASEVPQYAKSVLIAQKADTASVKRRKEIAGSYFISNIYCLFVDEAQDMEECFFELMLKIICKLEHFYFVGDPFQALRVSDKYRWFIQEVEKQEGITPVVNTVSHRIPACIIPLCNSILPENSSLSSCNCESGLVAYVFLSELDTKVKEQLASRNLFTYIKMKTNVFSTANDQVGLTHEFVEILADKYPTHDISALRRTAIHEIHEIGLSRYLNKQGIRLPTPEYAKLASQFNSGKEAGIYVESIQKIKGLEDETAYFVICNSLLEVLLGVKNNYDKETNLLYVALTRTKQRLLLIVDDDEGMQNNFKKHKVDIKTALNEKGLQKAIIEDWFITVD